MEEAVVSLDELDGVLVALLLGVHAHLGLIQVSLDENAVEGAILHSSIFSSKFYFYNPNKMANHNSAILDYLRIHPVFFISIPFRILIVKNIESLFKSRFECRKAKFTS